MGTETKIQWCDHTFNPWIGCTKVSPGCANCYAEVSTPSRAFGVKWGKGQPRKRTSAENWRDPLRWSRTVLCDKCGRAFKRGEESPCCGGVGVGGPDQAWRNPRVFCGSLCDWLDKEVNPTWRLGLLHLIWRTPTLSWLLLSKRIELWRVMMNDCWTHSKNGLIERILETPSGGHILPPHDSADEFRDWLEKWIECDMAPENVWMGTTVENQEMADKRIPELLKIPAKVRFLSCEPLLGPIALVNKRNWLAQDSDEPNIHWVIIGGESGRNARPCNVDWIRYIVSQCKDADVPCFVKQLGAQCVHMGNESWYSKLKHPKGGDPDEWPEDLRVRQFPS